MPRARNGDLECCNSKCPNRGIKVWCHYLTREGVFCPDCMDKIRSREEKKRCPGSADTAKSR